MERIVPTREELLTLVDAYHHERETHRRAAAGTHARGAAAERMKDLDSAFERRLRTWSVDERLRQGWRNAFHHGGPPPLRPEPLPPLLFRGRSDMGSEARALAAADGKIDVEVDGAVVRRLPALPLSTAEGKTYFALEPRLRFEEVFAASPEALAALRRWVATPEGGPPWTQAVELVSDGLVGRHFTLTDRGRRALAPAVAAPRVPAPV